MLPFKVHQFNLLGRNYLLLPKLTSRQIGILTRRLEQKGASVSAPSPLVAKTKVGTIHIDPAGLCWSASDPADLILPIIPEILEIPKERVPLRDLSDKYFRAGMSGGKLVVRLVTRLEASALWDALREAGECGLSPDEHSMASTILRHAGGKCTMLTDFPFSGAASRIHGGRPYYQGPIDSSEAASMLCQVGSNSRRSSYLPRDAALAFNHRFSPPQTELAQLFHDLGEWCFFTPS